MIFHDHINMDKLIKNVFHKIITDNILMNIIKIQ
jgi:hypothetical protein